jgi:hypothetical protein
MFALSVLVGVVGFALGVVGGGAVRGSVGRAALVALACLLALPWALFMAYYAHVVDNAAYYEWRSWPATDLLAGLVGVAVGVGRTYADSDQHSTGMRRTIHGIGVVVVVGLVIAAFAKPVLQPIPPSWIDVRERDGVCLQTTPSTCGACAASTVLRQLGVTATERELAAEASSTKSGTLNWLLIRALRRRGFEAELLAPSTLDAVVPPAIVGVRVGKGAGHFIALLEQDGDDVVIGEPLQGRLRLSRAAFAKRYAFDHFAIEVRAQRP